MARSIVVIQYPDGTRSPALSTTDHPSSSYGLPVVVVAGEALGPADCTAAGIRVVGGEPEALGQLANTGYPVSSPTPFDCTLHPDGTATYWSVMRQVWATVASQAAIPDAEWAARGPEERAALRTHLPEGEV